MSDKRNFIACFVVAFVMNAVIDVATDISLILRWSIAIAVATFVLLVLRSQRR